MQNTFEMLKFNLQLFGDGAAVGGTGGAPSGDGSQQGNVGASAKAETNGRTGSSRRSKSGAYDNVVFGKQSTANPADGAGNPVAGGNAQAEGSKQSNGTERTAEERRAAFREMIKGEFKEEFTQEAQGIINRRFKETKGMEQQIYAQQPVIDMMLQRYNIADGDMEKLKQALEEDHSYWEAAAEKAGMSVEQFKAWQKIKRENEAFKRAVERQQSEQKAQQQLKAWMEDAEALKKDFYPEFDLQKELANNDFLDLLKRKVSMKQAYELIHMEEIKTAEAKRAAQTASEQMQANIKAKAARPSENGISHQSAVITKSDVHSLTREDRAAAARKAMRGERIQW